MKRWLTSRAQGWTSEPQILEQAPPVQIELEKDFPQGKPYSVSSVAVIKHEAGPEATKARAVALPYKGADALPEPIESRGQRPPRKGEHT